MQRSVLGAELEVVWFGYDVVDPAKHPHRHHLDPVLNKENVRRQQIH